jgi:hypothetical protein
MRNAKLHQGSLTIGERTAVQGMSNRLVFTAIPIAQWLHDLASVRLCVVHSRVVVSIHGFAYGVCPILDLFGS